MGENNLRMMARTAGNAHLLKRVAEVSLEWRVLQATRVGRGAGAIGQDSRVEVEKGAHEEEHHDEAHNNLCAKDEESRWPNRQKRKKGVGTCLCREWS